MEAADIEPIQLVLDDDYLARRISPERKHLWLVAAAKSGSTWLTSLLTHALGWQTHQLTKAYGRREQEIDVRQFLHFPQSNLFSIQQHTRFSEPTRALLEKFRVRVVLQGRNLFDTLVSLRDHFLNVPLSPIVYVDSTYAELSPERQMDFIVRLATPWYLNFYVSWFVGRQRGEVDYLWVDYESLLDDTRATLRRILEYVGEARSDDEIDVAVDKARSSATRLNVGCAGRGRSLLTDEHRSFVRALASYYSHVDLSPIGL